MQLYEDGFGDGEMSKFSATFFSIGLFGLFIGIGALVTILAIAL